MLYAGKRRPRFASSNFLAMPSVELLELFYCFDYLLLRLFAVQKQRSNSSKPKFLCAPPLQAVCRTRSGDGQTAGCLGPVTSTIADTGTQAVPSDARIRSLIGSAKAFKISARRSALRHRCFRSVISPRRPLPDHLVDIGSSSGTETMSRATPCHAAHSSTNLATSSRYLGSFSR